MINSVLQSHEASGYCIGLCRQIQTVAEARCAIELSLGECGVRRVAGTWEISSFGAVGKERGNSKGDGAERKPDSK